MNWILKHVFHIYYYRFGYNSVTGEKKSYSFKTYAFYLEEARRKCPSNRCFLVDTNDPSII